MQSRRGSLAEAITGTIVGLLVAFVMNVWLYKAYGVHASFKQTGWITVWMTFVSLIRGYLLRRMFDGQHWRKLLIWCSLVYAAAQQRRER